MIKYKLVCKNCCNFFDSWFASSKEYENLKKLKHVNCGNCNSLKVEKTLMTPSILNSKKEKPVIYKNKKYTKIRNTIQEYQKFIITDTENQTVSQENPDYMEKAKELLGKAIPMWIRYAEINPEQGWMVIHLLKDGLFALDRYSEIEDILKHILKNNSDNIEVIASLSEI